MIGAQDLIAGALAAGALGWLARRAWASMKRNDPCGECMGCAKGQAPAPSAPAAPALVTIDGLGEALRRDSRG